MHKSVTRTALATLLAGSAIAHAGLVEKNFAKRSYHDSDDRRYFVYTPSSYDGSTPRPMVTILHGCKQDHNTVVSEQGWQETAEKYGFILVAPFITTYDGLRNQNCWGFWEGFDKEFHEGGGEVEDIRSIAMEVESSYRVDPNRRYIGGLSSGGFMANAAAVAHNEYWAAAFVLEGGGYKETTSVYTASSSSCATPFNRSGTFKTPDQLLSAMNAEINSSYAIPMLLMHSSNDCTVGGGDDTPGNVKWGGMNGNREAWLKRHAGSSYGQIQKNATDCAKDGIACTWTQYTLNGTRSLVETVWWTGIKNTVDGKGHYFPGGKNDGEYTKVAGPATRDIAWNFFNRHSREECTTNCPLPPAQVNGVTVTGTTSNSVSLSWSANTDADLVGYNVYRQDLGNKLNAAPLTATSFTDNTVQPGTTYKYTVRAYDSEQLEGAASAEVSATTQGNAATCQNVTATNDQHVAAGRATKSTTYNWLWQPVTTYYAKGTSQNLGTSGTASTTLYYTDGSSYSTTPCGNGGGTAACFTASNDTHKTAGRATYEFVMGTGYAYLAKGSRTSLGILGTTLNSLKESATGYWSKVASCN